ncbi:MAG: hypothetical protein ACTHJX_12705 [Terriglobales bacterium]
MNPRIGDTTDDYCTRCHRLTDHSVAAMVGDTIASTTCRTCGFQHDYRGAKVPARPKAKSSAFDQVLAGILGEQPAAPAAKPRGKKKK